MIGFKFAKRLAVVALIGYCGANYPGNSVASEYEKVVHSNIGANIKEMMDFNGHGWSFDAQNVDSIIDEMVEFDNKFLGVDADSANTFIWDENSTISDFGNIGGYCPYNTRLYSLRVARDSTVKQCLVSDVITHGVLSAAA